MNPIERGKASAGANYVNISFFLIISFFPHFSFAQDQVQDSSYDVWPDIYDFIFYNILPLIILLVYGPEKKSWFGKVIYYLDDLIIFFCICALPLIIIKTNVPEMDTKVIIGMFSFDLCFTIVYWYMVCFGPSDIPKITVGWAFILWYDITWWIAFGKIHTEHYTLILILMIFLTVVPIYFFPIFAESSARAGQIMGLFVYVFLIIYQSLWFNICFPISPAITKSIFGITLLSVGRISYYITNEDSGEHGFFNGFKRGLLETNFDCFKRDIRDLLKWVEERENGEILFNSFKRGLRDFLKWIERRENREIIENVNSENYEGIRDFLKWVEEHENGKIFFTSFKRGLKHFLKWVEEYEVCKRILKDIEPFKHILIPVKYIINLVIGEIDFVDYDFIKCFEKDLKNFSKECENSEIVENVENVDSGDHGVFKRFERGLRFFLKWVEEDENGENFFTGFKRSLRNFLRWVKERENVDHNSLKRAKKGENRDGLFNGFKRNLLKKRENVENDFFKRGLGDFSKWVEELENGEIFFNGLRDLLKWVEECENGENGENDENDGNDKESIDVKTQY
ncbi:hypothetical protein Glove_168g265 [Diversispora epigaea]|uniref:Uncharacterized protein n=1 Tax=Diversispora epigaea TaxID=1348612 RepID=A0A397IQ65_9GLOM|nr:hypothetical protein Glove_168g265 [Diversispora epigaea]